MSPGTAAKCHWQCLFLIDKVFFQGPYTDNWPFVTLLMHTGGGFGYGMHCDCLSTAVCSRRRPVHRLLQAKCPEPAERGSRGDGRSMSAQCLLNHQLARLENCEKMDTILTYTKIVFTHFTANHQRQNPDQTRFRIYVTLVEEKKNKTSMQIWRNGLLQ